MEYCPGGGLGFNHNRQALRIMTLLEQRYPGFPGLNLSQEVLDAQAVRARLPDAPSPLLEAQVVDAADSIAYDTHDLDDGLRSGLLTLDQVGKTVEIKFVYSIH